MSRQTYVGLKRQREERDKQFRRNREWRLRTIKHPVEITDDMARYILCDTFGVKFDQLEEPLKEQIQIELSHVLSYGTRRSLQKHWIEYINRLKRYYIAGYMDARMDKFEWLVKLTASYLEYCYIRRLDKVSE